MIGKKMRRMPFLAIIGNTWLQFSEDQRYALTKTEPGGRPHNTLPAGMVTKKKRRKVSLEVIFRQSHFL